jgi:ParB-like chromosome segregation protein Spo0J
MDLINQINVPEWKIELVKLKDLETELDQFAKADPECLVRLKESIETEGMRWPILITKGTTKKYKCYIGNTRVDYALKAGYKRISAILVKDSWDKLQIQHYWAKVDASLSKTNTVS